MEGCLVQRQRGSQSSEHPDFFHLQQALRYAPLLLLCMSSTSRSPVIDLIKAVACLTIVIHHLAFYEPIGPATTLITATMLDWFSEYGRMAVQVFLVLGGYLAACSLAPQGVGRWKSPTPHATWGWLTDVRNTLTKRLDRLAGPYAVALIVTIFVASIIRPYFDHPAVPDAPTVQQFFANALMLQDVLRVDALSAGLWYVAIDMQLFALTVMVLALARCMGQWLNGSQRHSAALGQSLLVVGIMLSLWYWNRQSHMDAWAPYFLGSYGLGLMAGWSANAATPAQARRWQWAIAILGIGALALDYRGRIAVALCTSLFLAIAMRHNAIMAWRIPAKSILLTKPLQALEHIGRMSYSVFLMHFSVLLIVGWLVNAIHTHTLVSHTIANSVVIALALATGYWMHRNVESFPLSRLLKNHFPS